jgi:hypothetical protein
MLACQSSLGPCLSVMFLSPHPLGFFSIHSCLSRLFPPVCRVKEQAALDRTQSEFKRLLDTKDVQLATLKADVARLTDRLHKTQTELGAVVTRSEINDKTHAERIAQLQATNKREISSWQTQADEARAAHRRAEEVAREYLTASQKQDSKLHEEIATLVANQQRKQHELRDQLARTHAQNDQVEAQLAALRRERDEAVAQRTEDDAALHQSQVELASVQRRLQDATAALQAAGTREQGLLHEQRALGLQLDRLELDRKRMVRQMEAQAKRLEWRQQSERFGNNFSEADHDMDALVAGAAGGEVGFDDDENLPPSVSVRSSDPLFLPVCV